MGGTSCDYSSFGIGYNGCTSYPNNSVLTAGAIVGIVIGSLVGLVLIIFCLVVIYKLSKRSNSSPNQFRRSNVYSLPMNNRQPSARRSEMYMPTKSPIYSETPIHNGYYDNA